MEEYYDLDDQVVDDSVHEIEEDSEYETDEETDETDLLVTTLKKTNSYTVYQ